MINPPFENHRDAALALLADCHALSHKEAGFLGHLTVTSIMSEKQSNWLITLLDKHEFPPLEEGGSTVIRQ